MYDPAGLAAWHGYGMTKHIARLTPLALTLWLCWVTGCSKSTDPGLTAADARSQATATEMAAAALGNDLQVAASSARGGCSRVGFPLRIPSSCPYDPATGWFTCTDTRPSGVTRTFTYQFRDAAGAAQPAYDSLTAEIQIMASVVGTSRRHGRARTFDDHLDLTISGLAGRETTRTWNGTGSTAHTDSSESGIRTVQSNTTVSNVVIPVPFAEDSWPLSGSITTHLVTSGGVDLNAVLTFNGTRYADLTVNGMTSTVDLARWLHGGRGLDDDEDGDDGDDDDRGRGRS